MSSALHRAVLEPSLDDKLVADPRRVALAGKVGAAMDLVVYLVLLFVWGLVVGAFARLALPGRDPLTLWQTALVGVAGSALAAIVSLCCSARSRASCCASSSRSAIMYLVRRSRGGGLDRPGRAGSAERRGPVRRQDERRPDRRRRGVSSRVSRSRAASTSAAAATTSSARCASSSRYHNTYYHRDELPSDSGGRDETRTSDDVVVVTEQVPAEDLVDDRRLRELRLHARRSPRTSRRARRSGSTGASTAILDRSRARDRRESVPITILALAGGYACGRRRRSPATRTPATCSSTSSPRAVAHRRARCRARCASSPKREFECRSVCVALEGRMHHEDGIKRKAGEAKVTLAERPTFVAGRRAGVPVSDHRARRRAAVLPRRAQPAALDLRASATASCAATTPCPRRSSSTRRRDPASRGARAVR